MNGYHGKLLVADLTKEKLTDEPLNEKYARDFLGSTGLAARYLYDMVDEKTDPLGPDNPLILMPGLLNGTSGPSVSRWGGATKSPYTGHYGDANASAWFGAELKNAGYDGIILKGKSDKPTYIYVKDGNAELKDATGLWGKDTYKTQAEIKKTYGDNRTQIACIGPASENLVLYGNIMTEYGHCLGRAGLGCVMGSKKVKAIAVRGKMKLPMYDAEKFREVARQAMQEVKDGFMSVNWWNLVGTSGWIDTAVAFGDGPTKYYTAGTMEEATKISGAIMAEKYETDHTACFGCPIRCRKILQIKEGKYLYDRVEGPEYETLIAWGAMMGLDLDMSTAVYLNEMCNAYGFDTISSGASAGYAYYLYNLGVISERETGGLKLTWGNVDAAIELLHQIGKNEGFGAVVAGGTKRMAQRYRRPAGEAVQTKGLEIPMHDPRAYHSMGLIYATTPRGADQNKSNGYMIDFGTGHPDLDFSITDRWADDKAAMVEKSQNWVAVSDSIGICHWAIIPITSIAAMINASIGWNTDLEQLLKAGERIFQLQRALSCKLGISAKDDVLPELIMKPIPEGGTEGHVPNMKKMLPEYYALRDWDPATGKPSKKRLDSLGMSEIAASIGAK
ncbi:MAG TPA: aldehyde ferredoxin oxidoreductase family protein [Dehalococcoidia bacterium]